MGDARRYGRLFVLDRMYKEVLSMNIIIPMAGAGQRFADEGYKISKPAIPTIDRKTGKEYPMVVCATMDLPGVKADGSNVTYIDRNFHKDNGVEGAIKEHFPDAKFITIDKLTEGQACTCLLAKDSINSEEELLIAGCDNGMVINQEKFEKMTQECDVLAFTYRHNQAVLKNPDAYGWMIVDNEETGKISDISIKKPFQIHQWKTMQLLQPFGLNMEKILSGLRKK